MLSDSFKVLCKEVLYRDRDFSRNLAIDIFIRDVGDTFEDMEDLFGDLKILIET